MKLVVDRIEENTAVVEIESGKIISVPVEILGDIKEGDTIELKVSKVQDSSAIDTHSMFEKLRNKSKQK